MFVCVMSAVCLGWVGLSEVHMLKSVDERTPLCGTPVFICVDVVFLKVVSLDVICNELSDGVRYVDVYDFGNEFMYCHSVKRLVQVRCSTDCACWWLLLVEVCCNSIVYVM